MSLARKNNNQAVEALHRLGVIDVGQAELFHPRTRDREDVQVLRCPRSGVLFLSRSDHVGLKDYREDARHKKWVVDDPLVFARARADEQRRAELLGNMILGRRWLDVGTGWGGILAFLGSEAARAVGIEPNEEEREIARNRGLDIRASASELEDSSFDVITLFHVLEHFTDPLSALAELKPKLTTEGGGGRLVVEVPHARDFLLHTLDCEPFREFTLWSHHLVHHTRRSLEVLLQEAGFKDIQIQGRQRYPLSNHLHWLRKGLPGGHEAWSFLNDPDMDRAYEARLAALDQTDTLVALARI